MVRPRVRAPAELEGAHLVVVVMDDDRLSKDDVIGAVVFSLAELHARTHGDGDGDRRGAGCAIAFDEPITHCGKLCGRLSGTIAMLWPSDPDVSARARESGGAARHRACCAAARVSRVAHEG